MSGFIKNKDKVRANTLNQVISCPSSQKETVLLTPSSWTSGFQNFEKIYFYC